MIPASVASHISRLAESIAEAEREEQTEVRQVAAWRGAISLAGHRITDLRALLERLRVEFDALQFAAQQFEPAIDDADTRRRAAVAAMLNVSARLTSHVAEGWLMGEPHPKGLTLGDYLRAAIDAAGDGRL